MQRSSKAISFISHRPESLPPEYENNLRRRILNELTALDGNVNMFICGMGDGPDVIFGECVLLMIYGSCMPDAMLMCMAAYTDQIHRKSGKWSKMIRYSAVMPVSVSDRYNRGCYHKRDRTMVDMCDMLIAVYDGRDTGGTANAVAYARRTGKPVLIIDPRTLT